MASFFTIHLTNLRRALAVLSDVDAVAFEEAVAGLRDGQAVEDIAARVGLRDHHGQALQVLAELCHLGELPSRVDGLPIATISTGAVEGRVDAEWRVFVVPCEKDTRIFAESADGARIGLSTMLDGVREEDVEEVLVHLLRRISPHPLRWRDGWVQGFGDPETCLTISSGYSPGIANRLHRALDQHRAGGTAVAR